MREPNSEHPRSWVLSKFTVRDPVPGEVLMVRVTGSEQVIGLRVAPNAHPNDVLRLLDRAVLEHGVPDEIHADSGRTSMAVEVKHWLAQRRINYLFLPPAAYLSEPLDKASLGTTRRALWNTEWQLTDPTAEAPRSGTPKPNRAAVASWAMHNLAGRARREGAFTAPTREIPASTWQMNLGEIRVHLADGLLVLPDDPELSVILDVWPSGRARKCLSVSWMQGRPWLPPRLVSFKNGPWLEILGFSSCLPGQREAETPRRPGA